MSKERKFTNSQLEELIQSLSGSSDTLSGAIEELFGSDFSEDDLTDDDHNYIDNQIFLCTECGWWCEIHEESEECLDGERICKDCQNVR